MRESDLPPASRILRLAFGTFIGAPDPENFRADRDYVTTRFRANPDAALAAEAEGTVAGSNFATRWGSFAFFGPLTVHPERWNQGVAQALLTATMDLFATWNVRAAACSLSLIARNISPSTRDTTSGPVFSLP
jgi:GNAT superfamily N-acetyltransferase